MSSYILCGLSADTVIATCAVLVAVFALAVSVWQGHEMRKHNRLSVRPHLKLFYDRVDGKPIQIRLRNTGIGPAFVVSCQLRTPKGTYGVSPSGYKAALEQLGIGHVIGLAHSLGVGAVAAGEEVCLIYYPGDLSPEDHKLVREAIAQVKFDIVYKSIYGELFDVIPLKPDQVS